MSFKQNNKYQYLLTGVYEGRHGVYNFYSKTWTQVTKGFVPALHEGIRDDRYAFQKGKLSVDHFCTKVEAVTVKGVEGEKFEEMEMVVRRYPTWIALRMCGQLCFAV